MSTDSFSWINDLNNSLHQAMQNQYAQMGAIASIENSIGATMRSMIPPDPVSTVMEEFQKSINSSGFILSKTVIEAFEHYRKTLGADSNLQKQYMTIADLHLGPGRLVPDLGMNDLTGFFQRQQQLIDDLNLPSINAAMLEGNTAVSEAMEAARKLVSEIITMQGWEEENEPTNDFLQEAKALLNTSYNSHEHSIKQFFKFLLMLSATNVVIAVTEKDFLDKLSFYLTVLSIFWEIYNFYFPKEDLERKDMQNQLVQIQRQLQLLQYESRVAISENSLKLKPLKNGKILASIPEGELVRVLDSTDKWLRVIYQDQLGWVLKENFE